MPRTVTAAGPRLLYVTSCVSCVEVLNCCAPTRCDPVLSFLPYHLSYIYTIVPFHTYIPSLTDSYVLLRGQRKTRLALSRPSITLNVCRLRVNHFDYSAYRDALALVTGYTKMNLINRFLLAYILIY